MSTDSQTFAAGTPDETLHTLEQAGAVLEGHFLLTSGRHSDLFMQMSQVWQFPRATEAVASALARKVAERLGRGVAQSVLGPAMGGVILGYEVARALGLRAIYAEKEGDGMALRRGFRVTPGERFLVVEDALTTGGSVRKAIAALTAAGGVAVAVAVAVDRSGSQVDLGLPLISLLQLDLASYPSDDCPLCRSGVTLQRPKHSA